MPNIGPLELAIVLVIALIVFGPKRLPDLGRSLGSGMREFKDSITGSSEDEEKLDETKRELTEESPATTAEPIADGPAETSSEPVEADIVRDGR